MNVSASHTDRANRDAHRTGYPRFLLRALLNELNVGVGSRVLIAGDAAVRLGAFFYGLGIEAECPSAKAVTNRRASRFDAMLISGAAVSQAGALQSLFAAPRVVAFAPCLPGESAARLDRIAQQFRESGGAVASKRHPRGVRRVIETRAADQYVTCTVTFPDGVPSHGERRNAAA